MKPRLPQSREGFSLLELLAVIAITTILMVASAPSIGALNRAGNINKASSDLSQVMELARAYAMAHQTYVRVAICEGNGGQPTLVILPICSSDGTLAEDSAADMSDASKWPALSRPLPLKDFQIADDINTGTPDTSGDAVPSASDFGTLQRTIPSLGATEFSSFIQFAPNGQLSVSRNVPVRHIKIGLVRRDDAGRNNSSIIRISGNNGGVSLFRDGIQ